MSDSKEIIDYTADDVLLRDARRLRDRSSNGASADRNAHREAALRRSNKIVLDRKKHALHFQYPENLPVCAHLDEIANSISQHQVTLICSGTGSGKSTQIPKKCLQMGFGFRGQIGHTQPRRIAARTVAARISAELGSPLGEAVGSQVRFDKNIGEHSRLKIMTDGILLEEIRRDRLLLRYDLLIIDEVHERSTNIDFLLAYLAGVLRRRPELRMLLMSATADQESLQRSLKANLVELQGKQFPVDLRYRDFDEDEKTELEAIDAAIRELSDLGEDILIFLPGEREIHEAARYLNGRGFANTEFVPLYGRMSSQAQSKVFERTSARRVILATNVAETSLTIPGVRHVIDSGLARIGRYNPRSKLLELPISEISQAAARQRAGRCGREAPGVCIRLYSQDNFLAREAFTQPEILRTNLANSILKCAALNLGNLEHFPLPDPPSPRLVKDGKTLLREIAALDHSDKITEVGKLLARLPVDARLGRFLLAANDNGQFEQALIIVAAISVGDCRLSPLDKREAAATAHSKYTDAKSDLVFFLKLWAEIAQNFRELKRREKKVYCQQRYISLPKIQQWIDLHSQLHKQCRALGLGGDVDTFNYKNLHGAFLVGFASLIGAKNNQGEYIGARGIKFKIHPRSSLRRNKPPFIVCLERFETTARFADIVASVEPAWVVKAAPHLIKSSYSRPNWDRRRGKAFAFRTQRIFGVELGHPKRVAYTDINLSESRRLLITEGLLNYQLDQMPEFLQENRDGFSILGDFEHKLRRQLVPSEQALLTFYEAHIPATVATLTGLNAWLRRDLKNAQHLRFPFDEDANELRHYVQQFFPDVLRVRGLEFQAKYKFDPGGKADGLTLIIPKGLLGRLSVDFFDTLCPGLLAEKITMLVKVLPKSCRKKIAPLADFVQFVQSEVRDEPLEDTLSSCYFQRAGAELNRDSLNAVVLPDHLVAHIEVIDDAAPISGNEAGPGAATEGTRFYRNLAAAQLAELDQQTSLSKDDPLMTTWQLRELSLIKESVIGGNRLYDYAAFVDFGEGVKVRYFREEVAAEEAHRHGVARLAMLSQKRKLAKFKLEEKKILLMCSALGIGVKDLSQTLKAAHLTLLAERQTPRTMREFDNYLTQTASEAEARAGALHQGMELLIELAFGVKKRLNNEIKDNWPAEFDYMDRQLSYLFSAEAIGVMREEWHTPYTRYLKGIDKRIERLTLDPAKDRKKAAPLEKLYHSWRNLWEQSAYRACEQLEFYLELEELHLKQFAPELAANRKLHPGKLLNKFQVQLEALDLGT